MEPIKITGELDAQGVVEGLEEIDEAIETTTSKAKELDESLKKTRQRNKKKDWKGLLDIFSSILPRGLQRTIRSFQGTSRAVRRASTSFNILKTSIAALGLPLLIQGLTWIVENWDKVSDFFTGTTEAMKFQAEVTEKATQAQTAFNVSTQQLLSIVNDSTKSIEEREAAQSTLAQSSREIAGLDLTQAQDLERLNMAMERAGELEVLRVQQRMLATQVAEKRQEQQNFELSWWDYITISMRGANVAMSNVVDNMAEAGAEADGYQEQLNKLIEKQNKLNAETQAELDLQAQQREAEQEEQRRADRRAKQLEYRLKLTQDLNMKEELLFLEGQQRREKQFEQSLKLELQRMKEQGASPEQIRQREEQGLIELAQMRDAYISAQIEQDELEAQRKKERDDAAYNSMVENADRIEQFLEYSQLEGEDLRFEKEKDAIVKGYEERFALVADNEELERQLQAQMNADIEEAEKKHQQILTLEAKKGEEARLKARRQFVDTSLRAFGDLIRAGEDNQEAQRAFAITEILINQGRAFASALAGATEAAAATGPAAPFTLAGYIASMFGALTAGFAQIKSIMATADVNLPGDVGSRPPSTVQQALIPEGNANQNLTGGPSLNAGQAYVVQSQLQGQQLLQARIDAQTTL